MNNTNTKNINLFSNFIKRWFFSTNHKDIGTLYLIFSIFAGVIGTWFSIMIRTELAYPGIQYFNGDWQQYNVVITGHAFIMIVRRCASFWDVLLNIYILIVCILQETNLKGKTQGGQEHVSKRSFKSKLELILGSEQNPIWLKLDCLNDISKSPINEGRNKSSYGFLCVLSTLISCIDKISTQTQAIMNSFTGRKSNLSGILTQKEGTTGLPKGSNSYGNGNLVVSFQMEWKVN